MKDQTMKIKPNSVLVDNWTLEIVARSIYGVHGNLSTVHIDTIVRFLEILTIHDNFYYDGKYAMVWKKTGVFQPATSLLTDLSLAETNRTWLDTHIITYDVTTKGRKITTIQTPLDIVTAGAVYYGNIAHILGLPIWLIPMRESITNGPKRPQQYILEHLQSQVQSAVNEILMSLDVEVSDVVFPALSSIVLDNCERPDDLIKVALEVRDSKECKHFRKWLAETENALQNGNLSHVRKNLQGVHDLLHEMKMFRPRSSADKMDVKLGLSPSIGFKVALDIFRPTPFHVRYIRKFFDKIRHREEVYKNAKRLFMSKDRKRR
jgi:hypothetical protein